MATTNLLTSSLFNGRALGVINEVHLDNVVRYLFSDSNNIVSNARKEGNLLNPRTGRHFELDVWLPDINLGFEFQDDYHYMTTWYSQLSLEAVQQRDILKKDTASKTSMSLVLVPCWWDGSSESMAASINFDRPDLCQQFQFAVPVPLNPPHQHFEVRAVPDVGELMYASYPAYFAAFNEEVSPDHSWWIGEKYDGIRSCWNSNKELLYSRAGHPFELPQPFTDSFPSLFLDGEAWFGRGQFLDSQLLVNSGHPTSWPFFRMVTFDVADPSTKRHIFEERYRSLLFHNSPDHPFVIIVSRILCKSKEHLEQALNCVISDGGEGIILRRPKSQYISGRSNLLWKLKATRGDREALVLQADEDRTLLLQLPEGVTFKVPPENVKMESTPTRGEVVTFTYENYSRRSIPVDPVVLRTRVDMTWGDVLRDFFQVKSRAQLLSETTQQVSNFETKSMEFWTSKKKAKMRKFCEEFAEDRHMDPLLPDTWYSCSKEFSDLKEARFILAHYKMSLVKALMDLFPEIGLKENKFPIAPRNYWDDINNRREFFSEIARHKSFDPLIPSNWYNFPFASIRRRKGAKAMLRYHASIPQALVHLFPEIGLREDKFPLVLKDDNHWRHRKNFFVHFAKQKGFDPHVAEHWYSVSLRSVMRYKGSQEVLQRYRGSVKRALLHLFPNIGLDITKFDSRKRAFWADETNRREFFVNFAKENGFDPLIPKNWNPAVLDAIGTHPGASAILQYYDISHIKVALHKLFPTAEFEQTTHASTKTKPKPKTRKLLAVSQEIAVQPVPNKKNDTRSSEYWKDPNNRRNFFFDMAKIMRFNPLVPENWYAFAPDILTNPPESLDSVLSYYQGSISEALVQLFPDIGLDKQRFHKLPRNYWANVNNQRNFFVTFAKCIGFDPLIPDNWYPVTAETLKKFTGAHSLLAYYDGKMVDALLQVFPNIGLDATKFHRMRSKFWQESNNRKNFFLKYAESNGFDPFIATNWTSVISDPVLREGASSFLHYYSGSLLTALIDNFPNIGLEKSQLSSLPRNYWEDVVNRRGFFEKFAKAHKFDPLIPTNWYPISMDHVLPAKKSLSLLSWYKGSLRNALVHLFPEIGLDEMKVDNKIMQVFNQKNGV